MSPEAYRSKPRVTLAIGLDSMADDGRETLQLQGLIDRMAAGDPSSREALIVAAGARLERLTRKMLRDYPGVHRWEQTDDVLQNAVVRLCRALERVTPPSPRDFFRLAATQVRRELIDLARRYAGPHGLGANHASRHGEGTDGLPGDDPDDATHDPARLLAWTDFHARVDGLPAEEREVFDLLYYQGLEQAEAASVLGIGERTVRRRWQSARLALLEALGDRLPGM